jgi:hypothetical protein
MKYGQDVSLFAIDNKSKRKELYPEYKTVSVIKRWE